MFSLIRHLRQKKENRERILALDLLRGTFLVEIIVAHVAWHPSIFSFVTGGNQLPASAAEGFFAISGLLVGYLYAPRILKDTKKVFKKIWKRAGLLWFLATFFTIAYTAWAVLEPNSIAYQLIYPREPWRFLMNTFTLRYSYGWAEFLNRYAVFMIVAPFAVWLIAKGRAWIVALASFLVWFFLGHTAFFLPFSAWQFVFINAIILGYYLPHLEEWFKSLSRRTQRILFTTVVSVAFISYLASIWLFSVVPLTLPPDSQLVQLYHQLWPFFDKDHLAAARVGVGIVWFSALYMVYRRYEHQISKHTRGVLEVLGRQSLFVYGFHALLLFMIDVYVPPAPDHTIVQNTLVTIAVLEIIYLAALYRSQVTEYGKKLLSKRSTTQVP